MGDIYVQHSRGKCVIFKMRVLYFVPLILSVSHKIPLGAVQIHYYTSRGGVPLVPVRKV